MQIVENLAAKPIRNAVKTAKFATGDALSLYSFIRFFEVTTA
jgi:hypothetical protein